MSRRLINSILFKRFFLLFISTFLLPTVLLGVLVYATAVIDLKRQVVETTGEVFLQVHSRNAANWQRMRMIAEQIQTSPVFRRAYSFRSFDGFDAAQELIEQLRAYNFVDPFFSNIMLYQRENSHLLSASSSVDMGHADILLPLSPTATEAFLQLLAGVERPVLVSRAGLADEEGETYVGPVYAFQPVFLGTNRVATIVFVVETSTLDEMLSVPESLEGSTLFLSANGSALYHAGPPAAGQDAGKNVSPPMNEQGSRYGLQTDSDGYWFAARAGFLDLQLSVFVPNAVMHGRLFIVQALLVAAFLALLAIGIGVSYLFARRMYRPIWGIYELAHRYDEEDGRLGELEAIRHSLSGLLSENTELSRRVAGARVAGRQYFIAKLLKGDVADRSLLEERGAAFGLDGAECSYVAGILLLQDGGGSDADMDAVFAREATDTVFLLRETVDPRRYEFVAQLAVGLEYKSVFRDLFRRLKSQLGIENLAVGSPVDNYLEAPRSFLHAGMALEARFVEGRGTLLLYEEARARDEADRVSIRPDFRAFRDSIHQLDRETVKRFFRQHLETVQSAKLSVTHCKSLLFDIKYAYYSALSDLRNEFVFPLTELWNREMLESTETLIDSFGGMERVWDSVTAFIRDNDNNVFRGAHVDPRVSYLQRHFTDPGLSLNTIAESFDVSPAHLSRSFKSRVGIGISDYISYLRIKKAKDLLSATDESLESISEKVGYHNLTSFIRRFKQKEGVTPGQYRRLAD